MYIYIKNLIEDNGSELVDYIEEIVDYIEEREEHEVTVLKWRVLEDNWDSEEAELAEYNERIRISKVVGRLLSALMYIEDYENIEKMMNDKTRDEVYETLRFVEALNFDRSCFWQFLAPAFKWDINCIF